MPSRTAAWFRVAEGVGFEIPKGSPGELRAAATAWSALGDLLDEQVGALNGAASTVVGADWNGEASARYSMTSTLVGMSVREGSSACEDAAQACKAFARALKDAKQRAKDAKKRAEDAITRRDAAKKAIGEAEGRIAAAGTAAENAAHRGVVAAAAGPAGAGALASAQADGRAAAQAREKAGDDLRRAREQLADAERDLKRARRDGEDANDDAERAARTAASAFSAVAASANVSVPQVGQPVPVSLRGASPDMAGLNGGFGSPFHAPGRFADPGDARAAQIAKQRQAEIDAARARKDRKGSIGDGLSGLINSATLGAVDLGGDKDSDRYRGGDLAGYLVPGAGVLKIGGKVVTKVGKRKAQKEAARKARDRALRELREKRARAKAQEIHLDKRPGETFAQALQRHKKARQEVLDQLARQDLKRANRTDLADVFSQGLETLAHHRPGGVPMVLSDVVKNWRAHKAGAEQVLAMLRKFLRE